MKLDGIKHVFWDLDHTLWDFDTNASDVLVDLFEQFDLRTELNTDEEKFIDTYKRINERCWTLYRNGQLEKDELRTIRYKLTFKEFNSENYKVAEELGMAYMEECPKRTKLMPGAIEVLDQLGKRYHQHIITNGFIEVQGVKQKCSGLTSYFDIVVCSEEVGKKKPHPAVFEFALKKAGAMPSESVMIGDSLEVDAIGAKNAGFTGIWYNSKGTDQHHDVIEITELSELLNIL